MSDSDLRDTTEEVPTKQDSSCDNPMEQLRNLLVGPVGEQLDKLQERLDNPELLAADVSRVLPESIIQRSRRDRKIAKALEPTIEESIKASVKKDPKVLVDALFPVMGPAIRKAISSTIFGMIQSFNQILQYSFSIQGMKWRFEALKTGKSFGEVVLLHTLVYQIEQVFLIHRNTGLVLQHVASKEITAKDPDLVSSMLTAIQDFSEDSFDVKKGENLETLRIGGNRSVWIEQGPRATLAAVIRGTPPVDYRLVLRETVDAIHLQHSSALESFDGDTSPFEIIKGDLEGCFQSQFKQKKQKTSPLLWLFVGSVILLIGVWLFYGFQERKRWTSYLQLLRNEPGIVLTETEERSGKYHIYGLRDPLAPDPAVILAEQSKLEASDVIFHLEPYHALDANLVLLRAKDILDPPETVSLRLENGILFGEGTAPRQWIMEARTLARTIPGIERFRDENLIDQDLEETRRARAWLEKQAILFALGTTELVDGQEDVLEHVVARIGRLRDAAELEGKLLIVKILGHTDRSGGETRNIKLSQHRSDRIAAFLVSKDIDSKNLEAVGLGANAPLREELTEDDRAYNRSVTFKVGLFENPD